MDILLSAFKPVHISCNFFLNQLKHRYGIKKAGYSGTLDPFAQGSVIVGFGSYTKLFPFISKTPKIYEAVLWLGAKSLSLDMENIVSIDILDEFDLKTIRTVLAPLKGEIYYIPPKYCAKKIDGKRAYELARSGKDPILKQIKMQVFDLQLLSYNHPYITFRISVSEGAYIRSIGEIIANALGVNGALCALKRVSEGGVEALWGKDNVIDPFDVLPYPLISDFSSQIKENLWLGRKFYLEDQKSGIYIADFEEFFSIIEIKEDKTVKYLLNRMKKNVDFIKKT
ncbi:tRNA pseudouridine(55) synthase TruB [Helicobacter sp. 13S00477-4]|uniref:tRNA pseudouridine(55) synthase TruB n=1 Tax=Helicobacter sp. 13S00477-4 TaxID=1905759 RepID=UPI000BA6327C|nr:tRNA pseudouridine(55) synthase TruB [Helicobacter sp. 13S00477-4]PAF52561.1 tRNA pseudouridine(55) synthase TruB [Helicobacter sp. 13S00477-4]